MATPGDGEAAQRLEEKIAFLERETDHLREQVELLWKEMTLLARRQEQLAAKRREEDNAVEI